MTTMKLSKQTPGATVCVYGHGPSKNPFYKEAQTKSVTSKGWVLIFSAPVSRGQKLLLINGTQENPVEVEIVKTQPLGGQMCEVEVSLPA